MAYSKIRLFFSYIAIYIVWGSTYLAISISLETLPLFFISAVRFMVAGGILFFFSLWRGAAWPTARNWGVAARSGFLSFFISFSLLMWAQKSLPSSIAALLISLEPAWFVFIDWLAFGGPRPQKKILFAQVLGVVGCAILVFAEPASEVAGGVSQTKYAIAALVVILSGAAWVFGSLFSRAPGAHPDSTMASGLQMLAGGFVLVIASTLSGDFFDLGGASFRSIAALLYLIVFGSIYAYSAYVFLLRHQAPAKVATHTFVNPIVAVFLGWAFANEPVTPRILLAAAFVVTSVILTVYSGRKAAAH